MSVNSFGRMFRVTTWGKSHGPALDAVVDGCPPGVKAQVEAEKQRYRAEAPNIKLDIDIDAMTPGDRKAAESVLTRALERLGAQGGVSKTKAAE